MDILSSILSEVTRGLDDVALTVQSSSLGHELYRSIAGFYHAIDWHEPFIVAILSIHVLHFLWSIVLREKLWAKAVPLILFAGIIFAGEFLNNKCSRHWRVFSTQNYCDPRGIFFAIMVAAPSFVILLGSLVCVPQLIELLTHGVGTSRWCFAWSYTRSSLSCALLAQHRYTWCGSLRCSWSKQSEHSFEHMFNNRSRRRYTEQCLGVDELIRAFGAQGSG